MKRSVVVLSAFSIFILEWLRFLIVPFRGIITEELFAGGSSALPALGVSAVFWGLWLCALCLIGHLCFSVKAEPLTDRVVGRYAKIIPALFALRIGFDLALLIAGTSQIAGPVLRGIFEALYLWMVFSRITLCATEKKTGGEWSVREKGVAVAGLLLCAVDVIWFAVISAGYEAELTVTTKKYIILSELLARVKNNYAFLTARNAAILCSLMGTAIFLIFAFRALGVIGMAAPPAEPKTKEQKKKEHLKMAGFAGGCIALVVAVKLLFLPSVTLDQPAAIAAEGTSAESGFAARWSVTTMCRPFFGVADKPVSQTITVRMYYKNREFHSFQSMTMPSSLMTGSANTEASPLVRLDIAGIEAYRYETDAVMYMENGKPYFVRLRDAEGQTATPTLTKVLETLIAQGYWDAFEYGCPYLMKNDRNFVLPYLKNYSAGIFSMGECQNSSIINTSYRVEYARKISSRLTLNGTIFQFLKS